MIIYVHDFSSSTYYSVQLVTAHRILVDMIEFIQPRSWYMARVDMWGGVDWVRAPVGTSEELLLSRCRAHAPRCSCPCNTLCS